MKKLFWLIAVMTLPYWGQAQILKKIGEKVKEKTKTVEEKMKLASSSTPSS